MASSRRIIVHDYSGHPFQLQLSRALARRGHVVQHQYCSSYVSGHGHLAAAPEDPPTLSFCDVCLRTAFAKYRWSTRLQQEVEYAVKTARAISAFRSDVAVLCNIPLFANVLVAAALRLRRHPYVFWHQDVYSAAIRCALKDELGVTGRVVATIADRCERWIARHAGRVVAITDAFLPLYRSWGVRPERASVIPNWAALDEIPVTEPDRGWLAPRAPRRNVVLYSGTLGIKHDPSLLLALAEAPLLDDSTLVVVSQGRGREWLEKASARVPDDRLFLHDFVDYGLLPTVLGSADVLLAVLEPDASRYSVPSKMLSYMCAGRPIVAVMDDDNAAARTVLDEGMGYVVPPGDREGLVKAVRAILDDPEEAAAMGAAARAYAERTFDIERIATAFEGQIEAALAATRSA
jgi:glycosyltransferase involved in cell wall biosynthesis